MVNKLKGKNNAIRTTLYSLLLFFVVLLVYARVFTFDFVTYDDDGYVTENPTVQRGLQIETVTWAFTKFGVMGNWHPVTLLSHMLDCQLFGLRPAGHHATSILLHALNGVLLFLVLRSITGASWPSLFVAAMFALHPLRVESVAWIAERKDVLSMLFGLAATWFYAEYARRQKMWCYGVAFVALALGLMAKPMLVTLPFGFLLLDYWPLDRLFPIRSFSRNSRHEPLVASNDHRTGPGQPLGRLLLEKIPFFALSAFACWATIHCQQSGGALDAAQTIALGDRCANAVVAYSGYLFMLFWPTELRVIYPHPNLPGGVPWANSQVIAASLLLIVITLVVFWHSSKRYLLVGWLWYVGTLVPVIGIVQVGFQSMADRYTYLPMIGLLLMIAWGGNDLMTPFKNHGRARVVMFVGAGCWLTVMALGAWRQTDYWRDSITLYERAVQFDPSCPIMHNNLGIVLADRDQHRVAVEKYTDAIQRDPEYAEAFTNRGNAYRAMGESELALKDYSQSITLQPKLMAAYYNRGNLYGQLQQFKLAEVDLTKAIELSPEQAKLFEVRGNVYRFSGQDEFAVQDFTTAIQLAPDYYDAVLNRGKQHVALGRNELALQDFTRAIELRPNDPMAYGHRADVHVQLRHHDLAIGDYSRVVSISPPSASTYFNRGSLLGQRSDYRGAIRDFTKALVLEPDSATAYYSRGLARTRLKEYRLAVEDFEKAIEIEPDTARPYDAAAWILATCPREDCRNGTLAVKFAKRACQLSGWKHFQFLSTLAAACAEVEDYSQAIRWQTRSAKLAPEQFQQDYRIRLRQFRANQPLRDP